MSTQNIQWIPFSWISLFTESINIFRTFGRDIFFNLFSRSREPSMQMSKHEVMPTGVQDASDELLTDSLEELKKQKSSLLEEQVYDSRLSDGEMIPRMKKRERRIKAIDEKIKQIAEHSAEKGAIPANSSISNLHRTLSFDLSKEETCSESLNTSSQLLHGKQREQKLIKMLHGGQVTPDMVKGC